MAFCMNCGKKLAEGETCDCQKADAPESESAAPQPEAAPQKEPEETETEAPNTNQEESEPVKSAKISRKEKKAAKKTIPANAPAVPATSPDELSEADKQKYKKKRKILLLSGLTGVLVLALIIVILVLTAKPYLGPVKDFMKALNERNTNSLEITQTLMPDFGAKELTKLYKKMLKSEDIAEDAAASVQTFEKYYTNTTAAYGEWKISFDLKKATRIEEDEFDLLCDQIDYYYKNNLDQAVDYFEDVLDDKKALENWSDNYEVTTREAKAILETAIKYYRSYKFIEATEGYEVKGEFIIKSDTEELDTDTVKFYMIKVNDDWVYYSVDEEDDLTFDNDDHDYFSFVRSFLRTGKLFYYILK